MILAKRSERECLAERLSRPRWTRVERLIAIAGATSAIVVLALRVVTGS